MSETLRDRVKRHEGLSLSPYPDAGGQSIGYGCRLPLTEYEAEQLLDGRLLGSEMDARRVLFDALASGEWIGRERESVVAEMVYQLGAGGVRKFRKMLDAIKAQDWERAADEMLDSKWASQTPARARELAGIMRTGGQK